MPRSSAFNFRTTLTSELSSEVWKLESFLTLWTETALETLTLSLE
jgi:hypothetical protein